MVINKLQSEIKWMQAKDHCDLEEPENANTTLIIVCLRGVIWVDGEIR